SSRLMGAEGLTEIIRQLQGLEMPAREWEKSILPARIEYFEKNLLDSVCLAGKVGWGRFSPPALSGRKIRPTSIMPITLYLRHEWGVPPDLREKKISILHSQAREIYDCLNRKGALFAADIAAETGYLPAQVDESLWELSAVGLVTGDSF